MVQKTASLYGNMQLSLSNSLKITQNTKKFHTFTASIARASPGKVDIGTPGNCKTEKKIKFELSIFDFD